MAPAFYTIIATATDEDSTYAAGNTVSVIVGNVAPTLAISGAATVNEGRLYAESVVDRSGADTISQWTINWGDGTPSRRCRAIRRASHTRLPMARSTHHQRHCDR